DPARDDDDGLRHRREAERQRVDRKRLEVELKRLLRERSPVRDEGEQDEPDTERPTVQTQVPAPSDAAGMLGQRDSGQMACSSSPRPCIACSSVASSAAAPGTSRVARPAKGGETRGGP